MQVSFYTVGQLLDTIENEMVFTFLSIFILKSMALIYNNSLIDQYEGDIIVEVHAKLVWEQRDLMFKICLK